MAFSKESEAAEILKKRLGAKVKEIWGVEWGDLYPGFVVRAGLDAGIEVTPLLRDDDNGVVRLLGSNEDGFLNIIGGDLYGDGRSGDEPFTVGFQSWLVRMAVRGSDDSYNREQDEERISQVFPSYAAKVTYLFDCIPGDTKIGVHSRVYILTFPALAWMNTEALIAAYAFLDDLPVTKGVALGGVRESKKEK